MSNKKDLDKIKKKLVDEYWTENLHSGLEELPEDDAHYIVNNLSDTEIWEKVNIRRFQQEYISDYIKYLWEISPEAFWNHIKISLDPELELLNACDSTHWGILCREDVPSDVFQSVLNYAFNKNDIEEMDEDIIFHVIHSQINNFNKLSIVKSYPNP